eukprot:CAMPEP_0182855724 /NCGR_PEP_ID=MMETSP0034_2-20130328/2017_1 /TAXON_ID=156128 /ORGANISM="Nephroselmis pyriformis, Strain CCMP717" /LENGTH=203 /DNA_ID=CAMNT_0024986729 /DNA_START=1 /DNA_END=612 /DNA_ORIENTATION=-
MASSLVCSLPSLPRPSGRLKGPGRAGGAPRGIAVAALWRGGVAFASSPDDSMVQVVRNAALKREGAADDVIAALDAMQEAAGQPVDKSLIEGKWELVFSSSIGKVPLVKGYMPVQEIITFEGLGAENGFIRLDTDVLFGLTMSMYPGDVFNWDAERAELEFNFRKREGGEPSALKSWAFFYGDGEVLAARSSGTGLNVLRRAG